MSSKVLLSALAEIVRASSQCSDFWKGGANFSRKWGEIVAEISNPETSEIGVCRSILMGNIELLANHCEMSGRYSKMALESAERVIKSVGSGNLADIEDLTLLEPWRDILVWERIESPELEGKTTMPLGFLSLDLRERGQEVLTMAELSTIRKSDCLVTRLEAVTEWIQMSLPSDPSHGILTSIKATLEKLLRIVDDEPKWRQALSAMEDRLGGVKPQIIGLEYELQSLRRNRVIEWGGQVE